MRHSIVVVDDDMEFAEELGQILTQEGYAVKTLSSTTFIQVIDDLNPDLLLLDVWFESHKSGVVMAKALHANEKLKKIPILLMSSDPDIKKYALDAKVAKYVQKPIDIKKLLITMEGLLVEKT